MRGERGLERRGFRAAWLAYTVLLLSLAFAGVAQAGGPSAAVTVTATIPRVLAVHAVPDTQGTQLVHVRTNVGSLTITYVKDGVRKTVPVPRGETTYWGLSDYSLNPR